MARIALVLALGGVCLLLPVNRASAQASKLLEQRTKDSQAAQEKSWKQVDQINKETDKTTTRLQQSRTSSTESVQNARSPVKKTVVGTASPYAKPKPKPKAKTVHQDTVPPKK